MTIAGEDKSCWSRIEAAIRITLTNDCRVISHYDNGTENFCQIATCPSASGKLNPASEPMEFINRA